MRPSSVTPSWDSLLILTVIVVEINAIPLTMRRRSFDHPSLLASHAFRHAFVSSRILGLLPRNHGSHYEGHGLKYDGEAHRGEEGTKYDDQERQQEDRYDEEEETEDNVLRYRTHYSPHNYLYLYLERWK